MSYLTKDNIQMTNKHTNTSHHAIREMQIKIIRKNDYTPVRMAKNQRTDNSNWW